MEQLTALGYCLGSSQALEQRNHTVIFIYDRFKTYKFIILATNRINEEENNTCNFDTAFSLEEYSLSMKLLPACVKANTVKNPRIRTYNFAAHWEIRLLRFLNWFLFHSGLPGISFVQIETSSP